MVSKKPFKNPKPGDKIEVIINGKSEIGILLDSHEVGVLLLKLDNGYNIGLKKEDISEIKIIEQRIKKQDKKEDLKLTGQKPIIDFILTGGTISSKLDPETGGVKWLIDAKELFSIYPEIFEIADIRVHHPFMKSSENMNSSDWIRIAKIVGKSLKDPNVKGVIVSHGTDTLHYTGAALSFMIKNINKPVVLTYSQRSSDRGSSDSRLNLICAARTALSDIAEVVLVGHANTNDEYCNILRGTKVRKMHTSRRDAFKPMNTKPIAKIWGDGKLEILGDYNKRNKDKPEVDAVFEEKVALLKFYPGQDPSILDYFRKKGYKGIVIEMTGLGHVCSEGNLNWIDELRSVIKSGIFVCACPQTLYGRLNPKVYSPGRKFEEIGVIYLEDLLPETAYVKLGYVLAHKEWRGSVATPKKMLENLSNEFNKRLDEEY
ncbi:MAG: Glu-tRNA(Gln) amidotransferase subunit GatD [Candidatus Pacearchaeota archaeon]|jgi:glutamyl-tRNA(Gln) amidotransferase subunit D